MDTERWKRVDELLQAALQLPAERQEEFVRQQCGGDSELLEEVRSLLLCDFSFLKVDIKHLRESAGSRVLWLWPPNVRCGAGDIGFRMRLHLRPRTAGPIAAAGKQA